MDAPGYRRSRRAVQIACLAALVLIPAAGIFRIDLGSASLMVLGRPVHLRDFPVVAGLAIVLATAPLVLICVIGSAWCGWACPQNTVSEWADRLTHRVLGRRADVSVESAGLQVAPSKNRAGNWALLGAQLAAAALILGIVPLFYFLRPAEVWALVSFGEASQFSRFVHRLYLFSAALAFIDIAVVRYFWCNYGCLFRFGQLLFRSEQSLHVVYDAQRSAECAKCNYCRMACITGVDPTRLKFFDRCVACGECIDACNRLQAKRSGGGTRAASGLLAFRSGSAAPAGGLARRAAGAAARLGWPGAICFAGCLLLAWGLLRPY
jgi:polyferredoxin